MSSYWLPAMIVMSSPSGTISRILMQFFLSQVVLVMLYCHVIKKVTKTTKKPIHTIKMSFKTFFFSEVSIWSCLTDFKISWYKKDTCHFLFLQNLLSLCSTNMHTVNHISGTDTGDKMLNKLFCYTHKYCFLILNWYILSKYVFLITVKIIFTMIEAS